MSDAHDRNAERLLRIRKAAEEGESTVSASEPTADVITQKIVQEITEMKRKNDALATQIKEMRQEQQKRSVELDTLRSRQHTLAEHLNQQQQRTASTPQASAVSATATKTYVDDKLLTLKVQLGCIGLVAALFWVAVYFGSGRGKSEPQQSSAMSSSVSETGRAQ